MLLSIYYYEYMYIHMYSCQQSNTIKSTQRHLKKKIETKIFNIESKHWVREATTSQQLVQSFQVQLHRQRPQQLQQLQAVCSAIAASDC